MREYHDLSNYYPTYVNFGKYTITKESNLPLVAQNLIDYYDGQSLVQQSNYYYRLTRDNKTVVMDTGDFEKLTNKYFYLFNIFFSVYKLCVLLIIFIIILNLICIKQ